MRHVLKGLVTEPSWRAWDRVTTEEGVTTTALLEAIGLDMAEGRWRPAARVFKAARRIDRERRSR